MRFTRVPRHQPAGRLPRATQRIVAVLRYLTGDGAAANAAAELDRSRQAVRELDDRLGRLVRLDPLDRPQRRRPTTGGGGGPRRAA